MCGQFCPRVDLRKSLWNEKFVEYFKSQINIFLTPILLCNYQYFISFDVNVQLRLHATCTMQQAHIATLCFEVTQIAEILSGTSISFWKTWALFYIITRTFKNANDFHYLQKKKKRKCSTASIRYNLLKYYNKNWVSECWNERTTKNLLSIIVSNFYFIFSMCESNYLIYLS